MLIDSPDTGKTHLAIDLVRKACEKGYNVRFLRVAHLVEQLETALKQAKLTTFRKCFEKIDLIIFEKWIICFLVKKILSYSSNSFWSGTSRTF